MPLFTLEVDGKSITSTIGSILLEMRITDKVGGESDAIDITLKDEAHYSIPKKGSIIKASILNVPFGSFAVDDVSGNWGEDEPRTMTIVGTSADMNKTLKEGKTRQFKEKTLGEIVEQVAGEHGFTAAIADAIKNIEIPYLPQTEQSDMQLLAALARRFNATFSTKDGRIVFVERGKGKSASGGELPEAVVRGTEVRSCDWNVTGRAVFGKVKAPYVDPKTQREEVVEITTGIGPTFWIRNPLPSKEQAEKAADARGKQLASEEASLSLTLVPRLDIKAGQKLKVVGLRSGIDPLPWITETVSHTVSSEDVITTEVDAKLKPEK